MTNAVSSLFAENLMASKAMADLNEVQNYG